MKQGSYHRTPVPPLKYSIDAAGRDSKSLGQFSDTRTRTFQLPDRAHAIPGKFVEAVTLAAIVRWATATLIPRIALILCAGAKKQVVGANTGGIVAVMANLKPIRNWAKMYHPRYTMRSLCLAAFSCQAPIVIDSFSFEGTSPKPAVRCFLDIFPKSLLNRDSRLWGLLVTFLRTVFSGTVMGGFKIAITS